MHVRAYPNTKHSAPGCMALGPHQVLYPAKKNVQTQLQAILPDF